LSHLLNGFIDNFDNWQDNIILMVGLKTEPIFYKIRNGSFKKL